MTQTQSLDRYRNVIHVPSDTRQRFLQLEQAAAEPLKALGVRLSGTGTFGLKYEVGYRDPSSHLLLLTLAGDGFFESDEAHFRPIAGDLLMSPVGVPMLLGTVDKPWTFLWFYIKGLKRWQYLDHTSPRLVRLSFSKQLHDGMEGLFAETGWALSQTVLTEAGWMPGCPQPIVPSNRAAVLLGELVAEYLLRILKPTSSIPSDPWQETMQAMWKAVEQSPNQPWSQSEMCHWLGVSPAMLQRLVRRLFDSSPRQMLIQIRMNQARRLLQQSDYPLPLIAREVGYADGFVFSSAFKRVHGLSPDDFRQFANDQ